MAKRKGKGKGKTKAVDLVRHPKQCVCGGFIKPCLHPSPTNDLVRLLAIPHKNISSIQRY
jgi:hypothetical protein